LPSVQTIRAWCRKENFEPGIISSALRTLAEEAQKHPYPIFGVLVFDEVCLRPSVREVGGKVYGYVDYGAGHVEDVDDDNREFATEMLTFVVRGINVKFQVPVAFLLINGLDAKFRRNMILELICQLAEHSIRIRAVTCDGLASNQSAAKLRTRAKIHRKHRVLFSTLTLLTARRITETTWETLSRIPCFFLVHMEIFQLRSRTSSKSVKCN
jgi:hypothetical protein